MKPPPKRSKAYAICRDLYEHGEMSVATLAQRHPNISRDTIHRIAADFGLFTPARGVYACCAVLRLHFDQCEQVAAERVEEISIVAAPQIDRLNRKAWTCNLSAQARRPDAGPEHNIQHYAGGTIAEPALRGVAL